MGSSNSVEKTVSLDGSVTISLQKKSHKNPRYTPEIDKQKLIDMIIKSDEKTLFTDYNNLQEMRLEILDSYSIKPTSSLRPMYFGEHDKETLMKNSVDSHKSFVNLLKEKIPKDSYNHYLVKYNDFNNLYKGTQNPRIGYYEEKFPVTQYTKNNGLFESLFRAYETHSGVVLRPNDLWSQVLYDFSAFVADDPETMRHVFVDHKGKKVLEFEHDTFDIHLILESFQNLVGQNLKLDVPLITEFDSSDIFDMSIQNSMVLNTFKHYFEFRFELSCGITHVQFEGTDRDWLLLQSRLGELSNFVKTNIPKGLEFINYLDKVGVIYKKFSDTRNGKSDLAWWNCLYSEQTFHNGYSTDVVRNGWIFDLFLKVDKSDMNVPQARTDVDIQVCNVMCKLRAGFDGFTFENKTYKPHSSIIIM